MRWLKRVYAWDSLEYQAAVPVSTRINGTFYCSMLYWLWEREYDTLGSPLADAFLQLGEDAAVQLVDIGEGPQHLA